MTLIYIAGRPLDVGDDHYNPGDKIPSSAIDSIPQLPSFVSAGMIYLVHGKEGIDKLPPHLFSVVSSKADALFAIEGGTVIDIKREEPSEENAAIALAESERAGQDARQQTTREIEETTIPAETEVQVIKPGPPRQRNSRK